MNGAGENQIQPASLDLKLSNKCWEIAASFLPGKNRTVRQKLKIFSAKEIDITKGYLVPRGYICVVQLKEELSLPEKISAVANAKSSTGRLDILTRLITDNSSCFDKVSAGYSGNLYVEIAPISFPIIIKEGISLNQLRFHHEQTVISDKKLMAFHLKNKIVEDYSQIENGVTISVDLKGHSSQPVGYKAKETSQPIDLNKVNYYQVNDYWETIITESGSISLEQVLFIFFVVKSIL
jgi:dCTP deaminase